MDNVFSMRCKAVTSGETVELYFYQVPVECGKKKKQKCVEKNEDEQKKENKEKREDNLYRARQNIRRIIWSNQTDYTKFLTLTYKDTVLDVAKVQRDITTFVQSMRRKNYDMKYLYVLENQRERGKNENNDGCLHIHMVIFIDEFIKLEDLRKSWKQGYVWIEKIDNVKNLGAYVCKYLTKDNLTEFGKRSYSCSLKLNRPSQERFYELGFSDSGLTLSADTLLNSIDINWHKKMRHDFRDCHGESGMQVVDYYQGKWKNGNILEIIDPLEEFARRLKK